MLILITCMNKLISMKKIIYILLAAIVILPSCLKDDKDIFDDSSANRMSKALEEYQKVMESKPNGWLMSYYPGRESASEVKAGYNYLVKFKEGRVTAALDYDIVDYNVPGNTGVSYPSGTEVSSFFKMIGDEGPILSFDTNNALLHYFCSPTSAKPYADYGDYEFTVISASSDSIVLRGKRYRNKMIMTPIPEGETWSQCLANIENIRNIINHSLYGIEFFVDGKSVEVTKLARGFTFTIVSDDVTETVTAAYRCTENGIQFYKPIEINGVYIQNFKYEGGKFVCTDGVNAEFSMKRLAFNSVFAQTNAQWFFDLALFSATAKSAWDAAAAAVLAGEGEVLDMGYMGYSHAPDYPGSVIAMRSTYAPSAWWAMYTTTMTPVTNTEDEISFVYVPGDILNENYYKAYFGPFVNAICDASPYILVPDDEIDPTEITFTSKADPTMYFTIYK